jgi:HAD superfamily hydrolase (TIGR01458 family)
MSTNPEAILLDLDGVLYVGDHPIPKAAKIVRHFMDQDVPLAGVTNTTTQSRNAIARKLVGMGIPLDTEQIYTPATLAMARIGGQGARLYIRNDLEEDFAGIHEDATHPVFVVMGDIGGEGYPPETLREIFLYVMEGATILALHKNRFWQKPDGLHLDLGVFVAAVEYATGQRAEVLGKPSRNFFHSICRQLGVRPEDTLMVGDDVESDIGGAQASGMKTALVQTGKYREDFVRQTGIKADLVIPSIADLPDALSLL